MTFRKILWATWFTIGIPTDNQFEADAAQFSGRDEFQKEEATERRRDRGVDGRTRKFSHQARQHDEADGHDQWDGHCVTE